MTQKKRSSIGLVVVLMAIIALGAFVTLARHGLVDLVRVSAERDSVAEERDSVAGRNQKLLEDIDRLKNDPQSIESVAREELGLAKPGELVYRFETENDQEQRNDDDRSDPGSKN